MRCRRCAKSVVNVDHGQTGRAAIQHAEQGRQSAQARAIPHAGWYGHNGRIDQPTDDGRQSAFHPGHHNQNVGSPKSVRMRQQAVNSGNADIIERLGRVA